MTVSYTVEVNGSGERGDDILGNFLLNPDEETPEEPVCEPVEGELPNCTRNPVGDIVPGKSVDPATGSEVRAGQVLTYTLSFENTGQAPAVVDYADHMADVLDDADWVGNVTVSDGLAVAGPDDDSLHITGTVAVGETATVTYQVRVKEYEDQGNNVLANFLTPYSETSSAECLPDSTMCTQNPTDPPAAPTPPPVRPGPPSTGAEMPVGLGVASGLLLILGAGIVVATRRGMALTGVAPRRKS